MKICGTCGSERPPGRCKRCAANRTARWREQNPERSKAAKHKHVTSEKGVATRRRYQSSEPEVEKRRKRDAAQHRVEARKAYAKTDAGKVALRRGHVKWLAANPEKHAAHKTLNIAVRAGAIIKPKNCQGCGAGGRINGHHSDYSKPLEVSWLCSRCHHNIHQDILP